MFLVTHMTYCSMSLGSESDYFQVDLHFNPDFQCDTPQLIALVTHSTYYIIESLKKSFLLSTCIMQGSNGRCLAGKNVTVAATSLTCHRCRRCFLYLKSIQGPSLGCLASHGGPVMCSLSLQRKVSGASLRVLGQ